MNRKAIISSVINKLAEEPGYEIPKIPKNLENPQSEREKELLKYIKKLMTAISKDPMTGLYTKQHFEQLDKAPGIYIGIDGDNLKKINDSYGHKAGHAAIEAIAKGIKSVLRNSDKVKITRSGGDEFMVHMEDVDTTTGVMVAKRILASINKQKISDFYKGDPDTKEKLSKVSLEASIGVGKTDDEADKALYKAKQMGRNRVEISQD